MTVLTRRDTSVLWYLLSSNSGLLTARRRRDINHLLRHFCRFWGNFCLFRAFHTVFRAADTPLFHSRSIQRATDDVVTNAGQILDAAAAHQDDGVFLQIVAFIGDIGDDLEPVGEADFGDFAHGRIGL